MYFLSATLAFMPWKLNIKLVIVFASMNLDQPCR